MRKLRSSRRITVLGAIVVAAVLAATGTVLADTQGWFGRYGQRVALQRDGPELPCSRRSAISPASREARWRQEKTTDTCDQGTGSTVRDAAQKATAAQVEAMKPALVAVLGDEQYQNGYYSDFENSFDKYWGAFKFLQRPAPGQPRVLRQPRPDRRPGFGLFRLLQRDPAQPERRGDDQTVTNPTTSVVVTQPTPQPDGQAGDFGQTGNGWYSTTSATGT